MNDSLKQKELSHVCTSIVHIFEMLIVSIHYNNSGLLNSVARRFNPNKAEEYSSRIQADFVALYEGNDFVCSLPNILKSQIIVTLRQILLSCLLQSLILGLAFLFLPENEFVGIRSWWLLTAYACVTAFFAIHIGNIYWLMRWKCALGHLLRLHDDSYFAPSHHADYLLWLLLPLQNRDAMLGDLNEGFEKAAERHGLRCAKFWYWCQALRSAGPLLGRSLGLLLRLLLHK